MTTPLSRLFWLACKHNDTISPLLNQPYKLLSIFEQSASDDGIGEKLEAETLKNALKRSQIYLYMKEGAFPRSIKIGPASVAWLESEIDEWINKKLFDR
ncbi:Predicted transcriptional regulator [Citrobacter freundii]|nr:Predicted transcriptional regulator [Citrobacter freundii]SUX74319.1 Predicted transcriptional regulator [Citrobacter freundii]